MTPSLFDDQDQPEVFDYEAQPWEADGDPHDEPVAEPVAEGYQGHAGQHDDCERCSHVRAALDTLQAEMTTPEFAAALSAVDDDQPEPARADVRHVEAPPIASGIQADGTYRCSHPQHATLNSCPWFPCTGAIF